MSLLFNMLSRLVIAKLILIYKIFKVIQILKIFFSLTQHTLVESTESPLTFTGVGHHFLFQGISLTQGLKLHLLYLLNQQVDSLPLVLPRKP